MDKRSKLLDVLSALGIKSAMYGGLSITQLEDAAKHAAANFGVPDYIYMDKHTYNMFVKKTGKKKR